MRDAHSPSSRHGRGVAVAGLLFAAAIMGSDGVARATDLGTDNGRVGAMSKAVLESTFAGTKIEGIYPDTDSSWEETYRSDGSLEFETGGSVSTGRWRTIGSRFCTRYDDTPQDGDSCFMVVPRGPNCLDYYLVDRDQRPTALASDIRRGVSWSFRGWSMDAPDTCPLGSPFGKADRGG